MKLLGTAAIILLGLTALPLAAQEGAVDTDMEILREKIKADKKLLVAANMELSETEGKAFWPIYDAYQRDLQGLNERLGAVILAYADAYNSGTLSDTQAEELLGEALAVEEAEAMMQKSYATKLTEALPGRKVARYMQIESKIRAALRYELAANIPLVE